MQPTAHPTAQDTIYALTATSTSLYAARASGLYRSCDGGQRWDDALTPLAPETFIVTAVASAGQTIIAGANGVILRSNDDGESWTVVGLAAPPPHVVTLALSPNFDEDGIALAGTAQDGVFLSDDGGVTWVAWNFGLIDQNVYALALSPNFSADRTVFVGTESGIFRSRNGGRSWHELPFPMEAAPVLSLTATSQVIYAGTEKSGLFSSNDGGAHWESELVFDGAAVNAIEITSEVHVLLDDRLFRSSSHERWALFTSPFPAGKLAMALLPHPSLTCTMVVGFADGDILLFGEAPGLR